MTPLLEQIWNSLGGRGSEAHGVEFVGNGNLPSVFAVSDLAAASVGAAGLAAAELIETCGSPRPSVQVDRRLASMWFASSLRPIGWSVPPPWDPIAGDYETADGWIRLHTNAAAHRAAAVAVLGVAAERQAVTKAVAMWKGEQLESAVVAKGGCAARMRSGREWSTHPQGQAVASEPLFHMSPSEHSDARSWSAAQDRPLRGIRVLDLTRVLAGPIATRFLAGLGADVLRIDPPWWDEPGVVAEVTLGKRAARLNLKDEPERRRLTELLAGADVIVHGYRPGALVAIGLDARQREEIRHGLVDVSLDAYGWSGPWADRRGFDSIVQMSTGIAEAGMRLLKRDKPTPLPVQALDHATGYLLAAAVLRGLSDRTRTRRGVQMKTSLARSATMLMSLPVDRGGPRFAAEEPSDLSDQIEASGWGPAKRLRPPLKISGAPLRWDSPAMPLGSAAATW